MSLELAIARVQEIQSALAVVAGGPPPVGVVNVNGGAAAPPAAGPPAVAAGAGSFSHLLQQTLAGPGQVGFPTAMGVPGALPVAAVHGGAAPAARMVAIAQAEIGQAEYPDGSNDSPRIAVYRQATAGSAVGPWCAYFVSWVAQQAGMPLGHQGQGFGRVDDVYAWAQSVGRAVPNGPGVVPRPGDLIVWDEHIGIVEQVLPDGRIQTIEGNSSNRVSRNVHTAGSALGYVRMS